MEEKRVKPIVLNNPETGEKYILEFNRESVKYAESQGFNIEDLSGGKIFTAVSDLFYYSFRMHHRGIRREKTEHILFEELGGLSDDAIVRLGELYAVPYNTLIQSEESAKNSPWAMEI